MPVVGKEPPSVALEPPEPLGEVLPLDPPPEVPVLVGEPLWEDPVPVEVEEPGLPEEELDPEPDPEVGDEPG